MATPLIRKYLLGQTSEAERLNLEERLIVDDHAYEELLIVEDELTDEYIAGQLSPDERKDFEDYFLSTSSRQDKVRFAKVVREHLATHPKSQSVIDTPHKSRWSALLSFRNPVLSYSMAIATVLLVVGVSWLVYRSLNNSSAPRSTFTLTLTLTPGLTRDGAIDNSVNIPPNIDVVRVQLVLEEDTSYQSYTATLESADGRRLATERTSSAELINGRSAIVVELSSRLLAAGEYRIKLSGMAADGSALDLGSYYFTIVTR